MKTATVRDLRNSFARISRWLEAGETVEVTKRGQLFARISPATPRKPKRVIRPDFMARLRADFDNQIIPEGAFDDAIRDARSSYGERLP
jgi:antitoxin (DNA-binding transcriptional repressor) of toxin-antitoxin stability system